MGRTNKVQPGQMAGATELRLAHKIPATKVPCVHAVLSARVHAPPLFPAISRMYSPPKSGWFNATGPSTNPSLIPGLPLVIAINGVSLIKSKGPIMHHPHLKKAETRVGRLTLSTGRGNAAEVRH